MKIPNESGKLLKQGSKIYMEIDFTGEGSKNL